ncbi:MAG TPA: phytoene/squalene synthase family protein [Devosia sp.]|jgi:phytoene synthase|uniref:phytoene/squalene synthase family protein n=1 Tax=Devosia sp. TaxID=1871048 RepID=UPI002DDCDA57|nr:phytoene/squalene synthase family protein [Devosia sp.]HEV2513960.1 phytoene/squalene synthase family protein [Devosia sp.]
MSEDAGYVASFLRDADRDRYFATLLLKEPERGAIQSLYAFNADVASIRDRAREPTAGEIRLQWWADALKGTGHGNVRQNPLAAALLDAISRYGLPSGPLLRLVAARRFDLYQDPMPDVASFEGYAGETVSVLYQLAAMVLNGGTEVETGDAAGHLGVAHALAGHLRAFGFNASQGRIFLPMNIFAANGVTDGEILAGQESEGLFAALGQVNDLALEHLGKAEAAIRSLPKPLRPAFASAGLLGPELRRLSRSRVPFTAMAATADWRKILGMWWWSSRS